MKKFFAITLVALMLFTVFGLAMTSAAPEQNLYWRGHWGGHGWGTWGGWWPGWGTWGGWWPGWGWNNWIGNWWPGYYW